MMNAKKVSVFICAAMKSTKTSLLKAGFVLKSYKRFNKIIAQILYDNITITHEQFSKGK